MPEEKIMTLHPQGKKGVNIDKAKYEQVKTVVLEIIESQQLVKDEQNRRIDQLSEDLKQLKSLMIERL